MGIASLMGIAKKALAFSPGTRFEAMCELISEGIGQEQECMVLYALLRV